MLPQILNVSGTPWPRLAATLSLTKSEICLDLVLTDGGLENKNMENIETEIKMETTQKIILILEITVYY